METEGSVGPAGPSTKLQVWWKRLFQGNGPKVIEKYIQHPLLDSALSWKHICPYAPNTHKDTFLLRPSSFHRSRANSHCPEEWDVWFLCLWLYHFSQHWAEMKHWVFFWSCFFVPVGRTCRRSLALKPWVFPSHPNVCFLGTNKSAVSFPGLYISLAVWFSHKNISKSFVNFLAFGVQFLQWLAEFQELFHFGVSISKMPINRSLPLQYNVWVKMTFYYSSNVIVFPVGLIIPISTQNSYWCHPHFKFLLKIILNSESCYIFLLLPIIVFSGQSKTGCLYAVILPVYITSYPWNVWVIMQRFKFLFHLCWGWCMCAMAYMYRTEVPSLLPLSGFQAVELNIFQLGSKCCTHWAILLTPYIIFYM